MSVLSVCESTVSTSQICFLIEMLDSPLKQEVHLKSPQIIDIVEAEDVIKDEWFWEKDSEA